MKLVGKIILGITIPAVLVTGGYFTYRHLTKDNTAQEKPAPEVPDTPGDEIPLTYEVKFIVDDETTTQNVEVGKPVPFPEDPTKEGCTFLGWALEGTEDVVNKTSYVLTENATFVALFKTKVCTVTFVMGDFENNKEIDYGQAVTAPTEVIEKEGYTFLGWALQGTTEIVDFTNLTATEDVIFEAQYEAITYQVSFTVEGVTTPQTVGYNETAIAPEAPEKEGYEFLGFARTGTNEVVDIESLIITEDSTFEAVYKKITASVSLFTFNGSKITAYSGNLSNVVVPMSYSLDDSGNVIEGNDVVVDTIAYGVFQNKTTLKSVKILSNIKTIDTSAFSGCSNLTTLTLSEGVEKIGTSAFQNTALTSVTIPSTVKQVEKNAFSTSTLTEATFTSLVAPTTVGKNPFSGGVFIYVPTEAQNAYRTAFKDSGVLDYIWEVGAHKQASNFKLLINSVDKTCAVEGILSGTSITIPETMTVDGAVYTTNMIFNNAFEESSITYIKIPDTVTEIRGSAFYRCSSLANVIMSNKLQKIGNYSFYSCSKLANINLPSTLKEIGGSAFSGCVKISNITLNEGLTTIGESAFRNCTGLSTITIPSTVTSIGSNAFEYCSNVVISFVAEPTGVETAGLSTVTAIYVPTSCYETLINGDWSSFASKVHAKEEA